jgi:hypothetical protein
LKLPEESAAAAMDHLIQQFVRNQNDPEYLQAVGNARDSVARMWRSLPLEELEYAYRGAWGKTHRKLLGIGMAVAAMPAPASPATPAELASAMAHNDPGKLAATLAAFMLSNPRGKLPADLDPKRVPDWLHHDIAAFKVQDWAFFTRAPIGRNHSQGMNVVMGHLSGR